MVSQDEIRKYFQNRRKSKQNVIEFCQLQYEHKARIKGDLYVSNYLETLARQVCKALRTSNTFRNKVLRGLYHVLLSYRVRAGMQSNKAPIFHPEKHFQLIRYLWHRRQPSVDKTFACRTTAVQAIICFYSFRRWVDATRIRWENCQVTVIQQRTFLKFTLAASKTNVRGQRNEYITLQQNDTEFCPVKILRQYWQIRGCPRTGFVLPCIHPKRQFESNSLFGHWDAYTCKGHYADGKKKVPCLGEINGSTSFGYYQRAAKALKWPTLPHKHSFRRAGIVIANKLDIPRERITEFFGWRHDTTMISLYGGGELATTNQGLAWRFSDALSKNLECLNDISFTAYPGLWDYSIQNEIV